MRAGAARDAGASSGASRAAATNTVRAQATAASPATMSLRAVGFMAESWTGSCGVSRRESLNVGRRWRGGLSIVNRRRLRRAGGIAERQHQTDDVVVGAPLVGDEAVGAREAPHRLVLMQHRRDQPLGAAPLQEGDRLGEQDRAEAAVLE